MKFTPEVVAALAVLRANAENDFERHRINVLERDLTAPPVVEVIDDTHQKFNGVTFYKRQSGHYSTSYPIHRAIWFYHNGDIPADYDIHHVDMNPANNAIGNLQCLSPSEHIKLHHKKSEPREFICEICGRKFFSTRRDYQNVRYCSKKCNTRAFKQNHMENKICAYCGKEFTAPAVNNARFCSSTCSNNALWNNEWKDRKLKQKKCPICEQEFTPKTGSQTYCSKHCRDIALRRRNVVRWQAKQEQKEKTCPACGKKFIATRKDQRCCSQSCAATFWHSKRPKLEEKTCPTCGKVFMPRKGTQIYCSNACACAGRAVRKPLERKPRTCLICGKEFTPKYPSSKQVCCSHTCGTKLAAQKNKSRVSKSRQARKTLCPVCGKVFIATSKRQIYCSAKCAAKNNGLKRRRSESEKQRVCPVCGKSFVPTHSKVICCSRSCGAKITATKNKKPVSEKICPVCGKEFTLKPSQSKRIYCSRSCASKAINKKIKNAKQNISPPLFAST